MNYSVHIGFEYNELRIEIDNIDLFFKQMHICESSDKPFYRFDTTHGTTWLSKANIHYIDVKKKNE
jgi:hypothetical protein